MTSQPQGVHPEYAQPDAPGGNTRGHAGISYTGQYILKIPGFLNVSGEAGKHGGFMPSFFSSRDGASTRPKPVQTADGFPCNGSTMR